MRDSETRNADAIYNSVHENPLSRSRSAKRGRIYRAWLDRAEDRRCRPFDRDRPGLEAGTALHQRPDLDGIAEHRTPGGADCFQFTGSLAVLVLGIGGAAIGIEC